MGVLLKKAVPAAAVYDRRWKTNPALAERRYSFRDLAQNNLIKPRFS
jgi:hypothetical protein